MPIEQSFMGNYRIVSIDGGGIRGALSCVMLGRLEEAVPGFLEKVDLFAGTSTGAVLALSLATGKSPEECGLLFERLGKRIFCGSLIRTLVGLGGTTRARYSSGQFLQILEGHFDNLRLGELPAKVLVSAFSLDRISTEEGVRSWKPKFFNNFQQQDLDERVVDVLMRSCAAPSYFPSHQGHVDGGVVAHNPSMSALAQALDKQTGDQELSEVSLLSIGTGRYPKHVAGTAHDWGRLQWAPRILEITMKGDVHVADYQCSRLLADRYHRIDPVLNEVIELDETEGITKLRKVAAELDLTQSIGWVRRHY